METLENNKTAYKEIGQDDFISEVIEASKEKLIVVDFWAPWCGPCKDLGPRIEKIISQTDNKVNLIKINIDKNKELASQLNIQSIPTVYAFKDAKIVNAFQGSIPEKDFWNTFNLGVGFCLIIDKKFKDAILSICKDYDIDSWEIGKIVRKNNSTISKFLPEILT